MIGTHQQVDCGRIFGNKTFYAFKYPPFLVWIISQILKLWVKIFSSKSLEFTVDSKNAMKYCCNSLVFKINAFELVAVNSLHLWWEYLASAASGLTCEPETTDLTKGHAFQPDLWKNVEKVG